MINEYTKLTANIFLNSKRLNSSSIRNKAMMFSKLLFSRVPKVLATAMRYEKEIKGIQFVKKEIELLVDNILY